MANQARGRGMLAQFFAVCVMVAISLASTSVMLMSHVSVAPGSVVSSCASDPNGPGCNDSAAGLEGKKHKKGSLLYQCYLQKAVSDYECKASGSGLSHGRQPEPDELRQSLSQDNWACCTITGDYSMRRLISLGKSALFLRDALNDQPR